MKVKRIGLILVIVFGMVCLLTIDAKAAWYTASIDNVGSTSSTICVRLTDSSSSPAFTRTWFYLYGDRAKEMLASVLTAMSLGQNVLINAQGTTPFSNITGIYAVNQ